MEQQAALTQSISFSNRLSMPMVLMIEPIGEDYWILPGRELVFHYVGADTQIVYGGDMFGAERGEHCVALYPPDMYDWAIFDGKEQVECGHNRPDGWAEALRQKYDEMVKRVGENKS